MTQRARAIEYAVQVRLWEKALRVATDDAIRRPLWEYPPEARDAVKHERRRRFKWDIDSEGER
jgi:hypothetical protein